MLFLIRDRINYLLILAVVFLFSCKQQQKEQTETHTTSTVERPTFNADSCFNFITQQIAFGSRIPNTPAQKKCANYLQQQLQQYGAQVVVQETAVTLYNGKNVPCYNIIASYNLAVKRRLMLFAHWDTRPFSDQDTQKQDQANLGVDDGASGVAVLLEIARQLQQKNPQIGVDIMLFDVEDYGQPEYDTNHKEGDFYALGTQYWCNNKHIPNYFAENGILLDMVGAKNATFTYEGISMQYAPAFMKLVWSYAQQLGYSNYFIKQVTDPIVDDHYYVNTIAGIPSIDIIYRTHETPTGFAKHWHTHQDNIENIEKATLQAVGETVLATIYNF